MPGTEWREREDRKGDNDRCLGAKWLALRPDKRRRKHRVCFERFPVDVISLSARCTMGGLRNGALHQSGNPCSTPRDSGQVEHHQCRVEPNADPMCPNRVSLVGSTASWLLTTTSSWPACGTNLRRCTTDVQAVALMLLSVPAFALLTVQVGIAQAGG